MCYQRLSHDTPTRPLAWYVALLKEFHDRVECSLDGNQVSRETFPLPMLSARLEQVCTEIYEGRGFVTDFLCLFTRSLADTSDRGIIASAWTVQRAREYTPGLDLYPRSRGLAIRHVSVYIKICHCYTVRNPLRQPYPVSTFKTMIVTNR